MLRAAVQTVACLACVAVSPSVSATEAPTLPKALRLEGLHAYAEKSVSAGETVHFRVSSTVPYQLSICRLGHQIDDPAGDEVLFRFPPSPAQEQPIHSGSYVEIRSGLTADAEFQDRERGSVGAALAARHVADDRLATRLSHRLRDRFVH